MRSETPDKPRRYATWPGESGLRKRSSLKVLAAYCRKGLFYLDEMTDIYNFSAGPAALPKSVLEQAAQEMLDWHGSGESVMEMSHRAKHYMQIHAQAKQDLADLLDLPSNYQIVFLPGGATVQFTMLPLNLAGDGQSIDFVTTGHWSEKAIHAARLLGNPVNEIASSANTGFTSVPDPATWNHDPNAAYCHLCVNETIHGVECFDIPATGSTPLVADASSTWLSREIDISRFGLVYGGAQKNIGPAGLTIALVRDDLLDRVAHKSAPGVMNLAVQAKADSMINTPPTYSIYIAGLVFQWLKAQGGVSAIAKVNQAKADALYEAIDQSSFYSNAVDQSCRSRMNIPFMLADESRSQAFLDGAEKAGLRNLKGHRAVGGMRASIYNAMPLKGVEALIQYMKEFEKTG
jgi:phosphoserine aminotransferase